jgi:hypothetical protein
MPVFLAIADTDNPCPLTDFCAVVEHLTWKTCSGKHIGYAHQFDCH